MLGVNNDNRFNINANDNLNNNNRPARGMATYFVSNKQTGDMSLGLNAKKVVAVKTYKHLWEKLCTLENLLSAYEKAKRHKSNSLAVKEFENNLQINLYTLLTELQNKTYKPQPLKAFVLQDPKTRVISKSEFRDRVVHHALINVIQPIFEPRFIHDSYASRKGKGNLLALKRLDLFKRKVTKNGRLVKNAGNNNHIIGFILKADIYHYFQTVDRKVLLTVIKRRIKDNNIIWLIEIILQNYNSKVKGKGMPLGNWTSQFFANVYLSELDYFVKFKLKTKYYIRYVDDFIILHQSKTLLYEYERKIREFLGTIKLELHPNKCKIIPLHHGVGFLGFRVFYHFKLLRKKNINKVLRRLEHFRELYKNGFITKVEILESYRGWNGYASMANTHKLRNCITNKINEILAGTV